MGSNIMKTLMWLYVGILMTTIEVLAYLFWRMLLTKDRMILVAEPNDWLFYVEFALITFAALFTIVFSYMVMLGKYRIEITDQSGLTHEEVHKARRNMKTIEKLKNKMR